MTNFVVLHISLPEYLIVISAFDFQYSFFFFTLVLHLSLQNDNASSSPLLKQPWPKFLLVLLLKL